MLYISVFCKHIETCLNIGYNLVLSAKRKACHIGRPSLFYAPTGAGSVSLTAAGGAQALKRLMKAAL